MTPIILFALFCLGACFIFHQGRSFERATAKRDMLIFCSFCPLHEYINHSDDLKKSWKNFCLQKCKQRSTIQGHPAISVTIKKQHEEGEL